MNWNSTAAFENNLFQVQVSSAASDRFNFEVTVMTPLRPFSPRQSCEVFSNEKPEKSISVDSSLPLNVGLLNALGARSVISDTQMGAHRHSSTSPHYPINGGFSPNSLSITEKAISTKHVHKACRRCQKNAFTRAGEENCLFESKTKSQKGESEPLHLYCREHNNPFRDVLENDPRRIYWLVHGPETEHQNHLSPLSLD